MPANMMVLSAGGYKFVDYAKAGIPDYKANHCQLDPAATFLFIRCNQRKLF